MSLGGVCDNGYTQTYQISHQIKAHCICFCVGGGAAAASATRYSPLQILLKKSFSVLLRSILWSDTLQGKQGKCTANQCNQEIMTEIH